MYSVALPAAPAVPGAFKHQEVSFGRAVRFLDYARLSRGAAIGGEDKCRWEFGLRTPPETFPEKRCKQMTITSDSKCVYVYICLIDTTSSQTMPFVLFSSHHGSVRGSL